MWLCGTALRRALLMLPVAAAAVVAASRVLLFGEVSLAPATTLFDTLAPLASFGTGEAASFRDGMLTVHLCI